MNETPSGYSEVIKKPEIVLPSDYGVNYNRFVVTHIPYDRWKLTGPANIYDTEQRNNGIPRVTPDYDHKVLRVEVVRSDKDLRSTNTRVDSVYGISSSVEYNLGQFGTESVWTETVISSFELPLQPQDMPAEFGDVPVGIKNIRLSNGVEVTVACATTDKGIVPVARWGRELGKWVDSDLPSLQGAIVLSQEVPSVAAEMAAKQKLAIAVSGDPAQVDMLPAPINKLLGLTTEEVRARQKVLEGQRQDQQAAQQKKLQAIGNQKVIERMQKGIDEKIQRNQELNEPLMEHYRAGIKQAQLILSTLREAVANDGYPSRFGLKKKDLTDFERQINELIDKGKENKGRIQDSLDSLEGVMDKMINALREGSLSSFKLIESGLLPYSYRAVEARTHGYNLDGTPFVIEGKNKNALQTQTTPVSSPSETLHNAGGSPTISQQTAESLRQTRAHELREQGLNDFQIQIQLDKEFSVKKRK